MQREIENVAVVEQNSHATADPGYVAGVDVGGTNLRLALADMTGTILARWSSSTVALCGPEGVIELICRGVKSMLQEVSAPPGALRSIAIGVPGVTDVDNGIVIATSYLMGWKNVPLRALVEKALSVPVAVDNDVNLAAVGEQWIGGAKDIKDFVFLAIGTGIGAGIVLNGNLYRGTAWAAGEIGYMLVPGAAEIPANDDEPGALESMIGGEGIKAQWQRLWIQEKTELPRELKATEIFDLAPDNAEANAILWQSAALLSYAVYNILLILNCPLIVLGGSVGMHPAICDATYSILKRNLHAPFRLVRSSLGTDAQLLGTVRVALDTANAHAI